MLSVLTLTTSMLFALVLSFYGNYGLRAFTAWPIVVSVISIMILITLIKGTLSKKLIKIICISSIWIVYQLLMTFNYINIELHIKAILESLQYIIFFSILFTVNGESKKELLYFIRLSVIFFVAISIVSLIVYFYSGSVWAFTGFHSNPNTYAVTCLFLFAICVFFNNEMFNSKLEKNLIICLLLLFVVITGSSKGFIGVAFVSVMYVLFTQKIVNLAKYLLVFLFVSISLIPFADKSI
ncbi:hypothetical protein, partial [Photobacterium swingsii]|uniref:hypothetical protein n=2 Tax=Photobacterium swingsii TaxID=680026 RepID=UPI003D0C908A